MVKLYLDLLLLSAGCVLGVQGQIGRTTCSDTTAAQCPQFLPGSFCNLTTELCECPTIGGFEENSDGTACIYGCGSLTAPANGAVDTSAGTNAGDVATYNCDNGYKLVGSSTTTCVEDEGWDNNATTCEPGVLGDTCLSDILCINIENAFCGSLYCECSAGYEDNGNGLACTEIDECATLSPCENGKVCTDEVNSYSCDCEAGYTGALCETDINECESNPCGDGGTCLDLLDRFSCNCSVGFIGPTCRSGELGDDCSTEAGVCDSIANATCDGNTCVCLADLYEINDLCSLGVLGADCSSDIFLCGNILNGLCENFNICECMAGYEDDGTGLACTEIDECELAVNPCGDGGTCIDEFLGYYCDCYVGFIGATCRPGELGDDCSTEAGVCDSIVNATCDGDSCVCLAGLYEINDLCSLGELGDDCSTEAGVCYNIDNAACNGFICVCITGFEEDNDLCKQVDAGINVCGGDEDTRGTVWAEVISGSTSVKMCPEGFSGNATRTCHDDGWSRPEYNCVRQSVTDVISIVARFDANVTEDDIGDALQEINAISTQSENVTEQEKLTDGEISVLATSLQTVADILASSSELLNDNIIDEFIESTSNILDDSNKNTWETLSQSESNNVNAAEQILNAVDLLGEALSIRLNATGSTEKVVVVKKNIALEVKKLSGTDLLLFPDPEDKHDDGNWTWINNSQSSLQLDSESLNSEGVNYVATTVMYRDMSAILPAKLSEGEDSEAANDDQTINAPVLSATLLPRFSGNLPSPIIMTFEHNDIALSTPACTFWRFQSRWATEGCRVSSTNDTFTVCACDHLTNFAVLMSPFKEADESSNKLRIISMVCIGISTAFLIVTICVYFYLWKHLRSDRTTVLMNLCFALLVAYIVFLAGIDRTDFSDACVAIAAVLQYIYLVVFCIMLVEGIDIALVVIYVFRMKSIIKPLLVLAWVIPVVIVGISLGVSKLEGYGNENFCWLSRDKGLIWAFVAPSLLVIAFNILCLVVVLRTMFKTKAMETKKALEKIRTSFWTLCVLIPIMGISWILGIFYINDSFYVVQYIFAILNGLQGFFIFLFHCPRNPQVKKALQLRARKRSSMRDAVKTTLRSTSKEERSFNSIREATLSDIELYSTDARYEVRPMTRGSSNGLIHVSN